MNLAHPEFDEPYAPHFVDAIHEARTKLYFMGGLTLVIDSNRGRMVADYPAAEDRASLYNELADLHKQGKHAIPARFKQRLTDALT